MITFIFTQKAEKVFFDLPKITQIRIKEKLKDLKNHDDIFSNLKILHNFEPATHRLRIGNYRLILELKLHTGKNIEFWVLDLGHRREIYK